MSRYKMIGPRVLLGVFISVVFASLGLLSCGGSGGSGTTVAKLDCKGASCAPVVPLSTPPLPLAATCTATSGATTLNAGAARAVGVAPLAVFFDATATTTTVTSRPFHDLEVLWDFGDPGSGTWNTGSRAGVSSRNSATGPVAAHVFEWSGGSATTVDYLITISAHDGSANPPPTCNVQITVQNPDLVFSGANTICFSTTGTFNLGVPGECPTGAKTITDATGNFTSAIANATANSRLLFRRGETWTAATTAVIKASGPGIVGAFGTGAAPVVVAGGDITMVQLSSPSTPGISDWRIMDLELNGNANTQSIGIDADGGINQVTALRVNSHDNHNPFRFNSSILDFYNNNGNPGHTLYDQIAIADCTTSNILGVSAALSVYASATRFMMLGNDMNNNLGGEHTVRLPSIVRGVISNNLLQGQGNAAGGKHAFTLRAAVHGAAGVEGGSDTQFVIVSDNRFLGAAGSAQTVTIEPQATADERIVDTVIERNWFTAADPATGTQVSLFITAREQTIRNNVFDTSGGRAHTAINISGTLNISNQVRVYNNTAYSADVANNFAILNVNSSGVTNVTAKNNLGYAPLDTQHQGVACNGSSTLTACIANGLVVANNSSASQVQSTDPLFISVSPLSPANAKPNAGSYAINGGTDVPVWSDFFLTIQPATRTVGAVNP